MRKVLLSVLAVASLLIFSGHLFSQEKGGDDRTGGYNVVLGWPKPLPTAQPGYIWASVGGIFAESPNRIFVANRGEIKLPDKLPANFTGFWGSLNLGAANVPNPIMRNCIVVLDANGNIIESWRQWDYLFANGRGPHSVMMDPYDPEHNVWVIDDMNEQIYKFSNDGKKLLMTLGTRDEEGNDDKHFKRPTDIAWLPDGTFFVSDGYGNARVVKFDKNGKYLLAWGTHGTGPGQFNLPHSVAVDRNRRVYVADRSNSRIQVFDENGKYLDQWDNVEGPLHIAVSQDQSLWVFTMVLDKFMKYDLDGHLLYTWGSHGTAPGLLWSAHEFGGDSEGNLYTGESLGGRPQKFVPRPGADPSHIFKAMPLVPKTATATGGSDPGPILPVFTGHGTTNFSGTWKLTQVDPPISVGDGRGGGGVGSGQAPLPLFSTAPNTITIMQSGNALALQVASQQVNYTLDDKVTSVPAGDIALETHAHWDGEKLHLHSQRGHVNVQRDILTLSGGTLTDVRDYETEGGSTSRTLTYTKGP